MTGWVLVVEDDEDIRSTVIEALEEGGWRAAGAPNGRDALEQLQHGEPPAVILLDLMMPVMDGVAFREAQVRNASLAGIPVVIMSADRDVAAKAARLGIERFVPKPVKLETLWEIAAFFCGRGGAAF